MKTKLSLVLIFMITSGVSIYSQCAFGVQHFFTYDSSVLVTSTRTLMSCCVWGNEYIPITNIIAGNTYTFDSCGATNNTTLTLFDPNDDEVAFSENECVGGGGLITSFVATLSGTYKAQVNTPSCGGVNVNTEVYITLDTTLSTEGLNLNNKISMYPNPTQGGFVIDSNVEIIGVKVYDIRGKLIKVFNEDQSIYYVDHSNSGVYFIHIIIEKGSIIKKLIKN